MTDLLNSSQKDAGFEHFANLRRVCDLTPIRQASSGGRAGQEWRRSSRWGIWICCLIVGISMIAAPAAARGATPSIPINAMNSSEYWDYTPDNDVIDAGAIHGQDCSLYLPELRPVTFDCDTEYYYLRPNGKPGNRWFEVGGYVTWTNVRVNPYGAGRSGTPTGYVTDRTSWIRRWHRDRGECMEGIRGFVVSNMPCSTATDAIFHQDKRAGYIAGTGTGSWPWLYEFPCTRAKGWTTCTNKVGDSYRFRGSLIIPR